MGVCVILVLLAIAMLYFWYFQPNQTNGYHNEARHELLRMGYTHIDVGAVILGVGEGCPGRFDIASVSFIARLQETKGSIEGRVCFGAMGDSYVAVKDRGPVISGQ